MQSENLIPIDEFCTIHNIEFSFIISLQQTGLIEIVTIQDLSFIDARQLLHLEKLVNFHYELNINVEGIETIIHMLDRINNMQTEINTLKNRLHFYEMHSPIKIPNI